ncbi:MAG TPA: hypothetical protein VMV18_04460 [bacterium]|nr:hypothetical protein [bacterium]
MRRSAAIAAFLLALPAAASAAELAGERADTRVAPTSYLGVEVDRDQAFDADAAARHAFLGDVLSVLEKNDTRIAKNTVAALKAGVVRLNTLDRLTIEDCGQLLRENPRLWDGIAAPDDCGKRVPREVLARVSGFQNGNRIYVNPLRAPDEMASTVVHELNHFVNDSNAHYATAADIAREEYRAFWVVQQFEDHGRNAGAAWHGWMKRFIVTEYALDPVRPQDLPDVPTGNLDNSFAAGLVSVR